MRPRLELRDVEGPHFLTVELPDKGEHHFRRVPFSVGLGLVDLRNRLPTTGLELTIDHAAAVLGACWAHQGLDLEAEVPVGNDVEAWLAFAHAVQLELRARDYTVRHINQLALPIIQDLSLVIEDLKAAEDLAGNGEGPAAGPAS